MLTLYRFVWPAELPNEVDLTMSTPEPVAPRDKGKQRAISPALGLDAQPTIHPVAVTPVDDAAARMRQVRTPAPAHRLATPDPRPHPIGPSGSSANANTNPHISTDTKEAAHGPARTLLPPPKRSKRWTQAEEDKLRESYLAYPDGPSYMQWMEVAAALDGRSPKACQRRIGEIRMKSGRRTMPSARRGRGRVAERGRREAAVEVRPSRSSGGRTGWVRLGRP